MNTNGSKTPKTVISFHTNYNHRGRLFINKESFRAHSGRNRGCSWDLTEHALATVSPQDPECAIWERAIVLTFYHCSAYIFHIWTVVIHKTTNVIKRCVPEWQLQTALSSPLENGMRLRNLIEWVSMCSLCGPLTEERLRSRTVVNCCAKHVR